MVVPPFCLPLAAEHSLGYLREVGWRYEQTHAEDRRNDAAVEVLATADKSRTLEDVWGSRPACMMNVGSEVDVSGSPSLDTRLRNSDGTPRKDMRCAVHHGPVHDMAKARSGS